MLFKLYLPACFCSKDLNTGSAVGIPVPRTIGSENHGCCCCRYVCFCSAATLEVFVLSMPTETTFVSIISPSLCGGASKYGCDCYRFHIVFEPQNEFFVVPCACRRFMVRVMWCMNVCRFTGFFSAPGDDDRQSPGWAQIHLMVRPYMSDKVVMTIVCYRTVHDTRSHRKS